MAPLILNLGTKVRWFINFTPRPIYSIEEEAEWDPEPVCMVSEKRSYFPLPVFETRSVQPVASRYAPTDHTILAAIRVN
jgi:hypothetical protein